MMELSTNTANLLSEAGALMDLTSLALTTLHEKHDNKAIKNVRIAKHDQIHKHTARTPESGSRVGTRQN